MFRIFRYRNFRLFFSGLIISQIGLWIQNVAISWLIYDITNSAWLTGAATFISTIPLFFFTPIAGILIDKFNKHKILIIVQVLFLIQTFLITFLYYSNFIKLSNIVMLGIFLNMLLAIDGPLRQSLIVNLIDNKKDMTNVISVNSSCFNLVKLIGPAISGLIIAHYSVGVCFFVNFLCIIPNIFLVSLMNIKKEKNKRCKTFVKDFLIGLKYVAKHPKILYLQLFLAVFCFLVMIYPMLMPIYTKDVYSANADILGFLMASIGFGALISSLTIAAQKNDNYLKTAMVGSGFLLGICLILFGMARNVALSLTIAFFMGLSITGFITPQISLLQASLNNIYRGRVMSYNTMCILGMSSLSTVISGAISHRIGITNTFIIYGIILVFTTVYFSGKLKNY